MLQTSTGPWPVRPYCRGGRSGPGQSRLSGRFLRDHTWLFLGEETGFLSREASRAGVEEAGARSLPFSSSTGHPGRRGEGALQCGAEAGDGAEG